MSLTVFLVIMAVAIIIGVVIAHLAIRKKEAANRKGYSRGGGGSSALQSPLGPDETDGYHLPGGPQSGVDYPSSWHGPNNPGGSLDI